MITFVHTAGAKGEMSDCVARAHEADRSGGAAMSAVRQRDGTCTGEPFTDLLSRPVPTTAMEAA